jgi:hypothetical protein
VFDIGREPRRQTVDAFLLRARKPTPCERCVRRDFAHEYGVRRELVRLAAPRVPPVGYRDDFADLLRVTADPDRIAVTRGRTHRVVQGRDPLGHRAEVESERLVLGAALRVARPDRGEQASAADLLRGAERVGERCSWPQRCPRDERSDTDAGRLRGDRAQQREALQSRPAARRVAAPQMVEDEHGVEPRILGRARDADWNRGVVDERRQREADLRLGHGRSSRAKMAAPTAPARSPSSAGTIGTGGR